MENQNKFISFIGGKNIFYMLAFFILIGIMIFIYTKVSFIFYPLEVILSTIVTPVILAFIAYYLLNPVVDLLEKFRIKRIWGIIILILGISGAFTGLILLTAPEIEAQVKDLVRSFPDYLKQLGTTTEDWLQNSFLGPYYDEGYNWVMDRLSELPQLIGTYISDGFQGVQNVASTITNTVVNIITFPIILFFLLKDGKKFQRFVIKIFPPKFREDARNILNNMDTQVGSYIQGQIIVASVIGILLFIGYLIIGLDYAFTLAIVAAVTSVVPYLGPTIAIIPAAIIAIVDSPFMLLKLAIVWIAVQFLEGNFVSPNIMGKTMQIHPLTIILVLLIAGNLFGVVGVILGIPGYALVKVIGTYIFYKFKKRYNKYFGDETGKYEIE
ncbi:Predicted PurR-regulated permease PerM [Gracilibacillus ureilyticus]|uniref:Predicted PurR-regulated permease PerM n=2 Tax=Gracilibacillus ureilyticus TaxID=531814 RepID=A0A1H9Q354_9BACI|nr:AI-2E family transporter [Gracilibacillus ureilyticus]SER54891.1 Predicted PurR-regulated permease PerM [Gracilibacillus ureilyticus]